MGFDGPLGDGGGRRGGKSASHQRQLSGQHSRGVSRVPLRGRAKVPEGCVGTLKAAFVLHYLPVGLPTRTWLKTEISFPGKKGVGRLSPGAKIHISVTRSALFIICPN